MNVKYNSEIHHRRSVRLKDYDYAQAGAYFVTICVHSKECIFGEITDGVMEMNSIGEIAFEEWIKSAEIRDEVEIGEYVVMPNHIHGIIVMNPSYVGAYGHTPLPEQHHDTLLRSPSKTIGAMVRGFKSAVTTRINTIRNTAGVPVWQRNFHEHVIRNEDDYSRIVEYVLTNSLRWDDDQLHPRNSD